MKTWNLKSGDPGAYILAADARCGGTDYVNDIIWRLHLARSEPPSLALRTSFGLRARSFRMFPRFVEGDTAITDPAAFSTPPAVRQFYPNYLRVTFSPFMGIDVEIEYRVPDSHSIAGRVTITNSRLTARDFRFEWAALLRPDPEGERMAADKMEAVTILKGKSGGLAPVVFITGGPELSAGPYPALSLDLELAPGGRRQFTWVFAGLPEAEASFGRVRELVTQNWDAELARLEVINGRGLQIETGNPDWDAAFALAQKTAFNLLAGPTENLPHPSFVLSRQPDQGYSPLGDGSDYAQDWSGQTALETDYLVSQLLPGYPELAKNLLENFLAVQTPQGFIDWKPGLGGQRGRMLATPLLTNTAWRIYQATEDREYLKAVFPKLLAFIQVWFTAGQDRDGDGIPEWSHPLQSGYEDHPAFSQWHEWSQGIDISQVESPALCAMLYNEVRLLTRMAKIIEHSSPVTALEALADNLKSAVEASWDTRNNLYQHWDRETHLSPVGEVLGTRQGPGELYLQRDFEQAVRLHIQIRSAEERPRPAALFIHGTGASQMHRVESIPEERIRWYLGRGDVTSGRVYQHIEHIQISGIEAEDQISVRVVDLAVQDQTLLLPLWAGIPDKNRGKKLVTRTIRDEDRFWKPYGIPSFIHLHADAETSAAYDVSIIWNALIGEGLLRYGYAQDAVTLFTRLMETVTANLKRDQTFYQHYHALTGSGSGERDTLRGLPPIGLFLEILGVRILSPRRIALHGHNPFPMPVTLKFRGLTIVREKKRTRLTFPGGQTAVIKSPKPRVVTIEA